MPDLGLFALVVLIGVKEAGVPIPVPGDLLLIGTGIAVARGTVDPVVAVPAIVVAAIVGGLVQYLILRRLARDRIFRLLGRIGITPARVERQTEPLRRRGAAGVAVARMTPGLRVVAIAAAALAAVPFVRFAIGLAVGNAVFSTAHIALGVLVGPAAIQIAGRFGLAGAVAVTAFIAIGAIGWWVIARRRRGRATGRTPALSSEPGSDAGVDLGGDLGAPLAADWADASCPACLAIGAAAMLRMSAAETV
ncbi:MAG TPA: VTT domain-containing protein [Candidatus Limnocylindrales bacterium]